MWGVEVLFALVGGSAPSFTLLGLDLRCRPVALLGQAPGARLTSGRELVALAATKFCSRAGPLEYPNSSVPGLADAACNLSAWTMTTLVSALPSQRSVYPKYYQTKGAC